MHPTIDEWIARDAVPFTDEGIDRMIATIPEVELLGFGEALHGGVRVLGLLAHLLHPLLHPPHTLLPLPRRRWRWTGRRATISRGVGTWRATPGGVLSTRASLLFATARRGGSCWHCGGTFCSTQSAPLWW